MQNDFKPHDLMNDKSIDKQKVKIVFENFAKNECLNVSPLYYELSYKLANDNELLEIASHTAPRQPIPNLFFGAVHYLLLRNPTVKLAAYYPSISEGLVEELPFGLFKEFCLSNSAEIIEILKTKIVQTNALNRTAYLMPIIYSLFEDGEKVNLIDIGASAGLNLNFDMYEYNYGNDCKFGKSSVNIKSEIKGGELPKFSNNIKINKKIGVDQNPLNIKETDSSAWLKALIWPDLTERFKRIENVINLAQKTTIELIKAQRIDDFKTIILAQDINTPLVIYHTHVLYQFTQKGRTSFRAMIDSMGETRDLFYLAAEGSTILSNNYHQKGVLVELIRYKNGKKTNQLMAETNGHADWIKWIN